MLNGIHWISTYLFDGILASRLFLQARRLADITATPLLLTYLLIWYLATLWRAIPDSESKADDTIYVLVEDFKHFKHFRMYN